MLSCYYFNVFELHLELYDLCVFSFFLGIYVWIKQRERNHNTTQEMVFVSRDYIYAVYWLRMWIGADPISFRGETVADPD